MQNKYSHLSERELTIEMDALVEAYYQRVHAPKPFEPGSSTVPVSGRVFGCEEMKMLMEASMDFWLTTGRFNAAFEKKLGSFVGTKKVLTVNSGSSANLVAVSALTSPMLGERQLKPGDEVITCGTGFPTTVNPIIQNRLVPVFLDVDIPTYNMDVSQLEAALSSRTRAIVLAHTLGNPFDLGTIMTFAEKHDLRVIEDCCDALGATYNGQHVGTFGDVGTLSFYPAHHITMGEGGAVFTRDSMMRRAMESIRDWGRDCWCEPGMDNTCKSRYNWMLGSLPHGYDHKYCYSNLGYNLKITDMQAAVGLAQLSRLERFIDTRRRNFTYMTERMKEFEDVFILPEATKNSDPSWFGYVLSLREDSGIVRDKLLQYLNSRHIGTRLLFAGNLTRQPYMMEQEFRVVSELKVSDFVMRNTFWLGVYPGISITMIDYMVDEIRAFLGR